MNTVSLVSMHAAAARGAGEQSFKTIALFCSFGLLVSVGLMMLGVDLGAGWA